MKSATRLVSSVLLLFAAAPFLSAAPLREPYPLEYFALREVVSNVRVSPDGRYLAMLKILSRDGDPILHVYQAADLEHKPLVVNSDPMEIRSFSWVSDSDIAMVLRQKVREKIAGQNEGVYEFKLALLDVAKEEFNDFNAPEPNVENLLPKEKNKIIISMQPGMEEHLSLAEPFRPRAYYKLDLDRQSRELLIRGKIDLGQIEFDEDGDPWLARGFDLGRQEYVWYHRPKGESGWTDILRLHEDSFEQVEVVGQDFAKPGNVLVVAHNGNDKRGFWSYNTKTKKFEELIYRRTDVDVSGWVMHSNDWTYPDHVVGITWFKDRIHKEFFDEVEGATHAQLEQLIPFSSHVTIASRSRDGNTLVAINRGPHDPGTFYLYKEGLFEKVGGHQPLIDNEDLADVEYTEYVARDGLKVPGYITIPHGEPPFPLIVMPHGGPFVAEFVAYDEWAQMLANNGFMVLQPQYRGSHNYGLAHYFAAWRDGSEAGRKMQDDKDDGALYLVEQGLADKDRLAMFGWSYGGYAALVAASRKPQIYQCVIAGAAVSDMVKQVNTIANEVWFRGAGEIEQMSYRKGAINPVDEVEDVNVPILLIHGSVDQRVQPIQAKIYYDRLDRYRKPYKFVELKGADHFYDTLYFEHQIRLYEAMIEFLNNDCGPGGL
jgi:dipeptidyl aminopeptidase/acylaminoacyl peptidase